MAGFYRGSTPKFKITPNGGYSVSDLGVPSVTLSQELVFKDLPVEIDTENNCIIAKLSYKDSLNFVAGVSAQLQCIWTNDSDDPEEINVVPFAPHDLQVFENRIEFEFDENGNVIE